MTDEAVGRRNELVELTRGGRLLVWTMRRMVIRRGLCALASRDFDREYGGDGGEVLGAFAVFVTMLGHSARRRISVGHPGCCGLTWDERQILSVLAAAQDDDPPRLCALLCWLVRPELQQSLALVARALATAFAVHGLVISPAAAPDRSKPVRPAAPLRLVG